MTLCVLSARRPNGEALTLSRDGILRLTSARPWVFDHPRDAAARVAKLAPVWRGLTFTVEPFNPRLHS